MPPTSEAITGTPRSMASRMMRLRASAQREGTSRIRVRARMRSISSTGSTTRMLGWASRAARSSGVVPQVGTAAKGRFGNAPARAGRRLVPRGGAGAVVLGRAIGGAAIFARGAPGRDGGEGEIRERAGEGEEDGDA